jgi:hypothetical protein
MDEIEVLIEAKYVISALIRGQVNLLLSSKKECVASILEVSICFVITPEPKPENCGLRSTGETQRIVCYYD